MATRDHQDLGTSLCTLGGIGRAHFFHSKHPEPDPSRHVADDPFTTSISWPNYHSGANGDYQEIHVEAPHELMSNPASPSGLIKFFPAHPHEGAVGVPEGEEQAHVIATGKSKVTDRPFNLSLLLKVQSTITATNSDAASRSRAFIISWITTGTPIWAVRVF